MTNWGSICNGKSLEGIGFCRNFASETKIKKDMRNMSPTTISNLQLACHYWERARRQDSRQAAAAYYNKAYALILKEMGENNSSTLELRKEMTEKTNLQYLGGQNLRTR